MTLAEDLNKTAELAGFTKADMAVWLEHDDSAVQKWFYGHHPNTPIKHKHVVRRLDLLRKTLKSSADLPVPPHVNQYERKAYIQKVLRHALDSVPKPNSSERRV